MSKIALTKRVSITMRGFSILKQYCPGLHRERLRMN